MKKKHDRHRLKEWIRAALALPSAPKGAHGPRRRRGALAGALALPLALAVRRPYADHNVPPPQNRTNHNNKD